MRRLAHAGLVLAGVLAVVWALTWGAHPTITCRDVVMGPGDTCVNADGSRTQTYEERRDAAERARPVVGGVGVLLAGFGAALYVAERSGATSGSVKARAGEVQASNDIGP